MLIIDICPRLTLNCHNFWTNKKTGFEGKSHRPTLANIGHNLLLQNIVTNCEKIDVIIFWLSQMPPLKGLKKKILAKFCALDYHKRKHFFFAGWWWKIKLAVVNTLNARKNPLTICFDIKTAPHVGRDNGSYPVLKPFYLLMEGKSFKVSYICLEMRGVFQREHQSIRVNYLFLLYITIFCYCSIKVFVVEHIPSDFLCISIFNSGNLV